MLISRVAVCPQAVERCRMVGRVRAKLCHQTAVTYRRAAAGTVNLREHNPVYSLAPGHLAHAKRSADRIISGVGQLPRSLRDTEQYVPAGGLPGFGGLPPNEECASVRGNENHAFAWPGGPSFLAALDIAEPAMPVHQFRRVPAARAPRSQGHRGPLARRPSAAACRLRPLGTPGPGWHGCQPVGPEPQTSAKHALRMRHGHGDSQVGPFAVGAPFPSQPSRRFLGGGGARTGLPA